MQASDDIGDAGLKLLADLQVQSMMFDMDIDYETLSLVPKSKDETPFWIKRWREKTTGGDFTIYDNGN